MKKLELCYEHVACDLYLNTELQAVHALWKGVFVKGEMLRVVYDHIIELIKVTQTSALFTDARKMKIINDVDQQWIINDWYPRAYAQGFCIEALMVTTGSFNELTLHKIIKQYDASKIVTRFFNDYNEASSWLKVYTAWKEWSV